MPVAVELNYPGTTKDNYDAIIKAMGSPGPGSPHPGGALFHWSAATSDGFRVVDVWDTREHFEQFAQEQIAPVAEQAGMADPEIQYTDIHNYYVAG
jgi:hypothetical protein